MSRARHFRHDYRPATIHASDAAASTPILFGPSPVRIPLDTTGYQIELSTRSTNGNVALQITLDSGASGR